MVLYELIQQRLVTLQPQQLKLVDNSAAHKGHAGSRNGAAHLELHIASEQFAGLHSVACHRLVYAQLVDLIPYPIHALSIKIIRE